MLIASWTVLDPQSICLLTITSKMTSQTSAQKKEDVHKRLCSVSHKGWKATINVINIDMWQLLFYYYYEIRVCSFIWCIFCWPVSEQIGIKIELVTKSTFQLQSPFSPVFAAKAAIWPRAPVLPWAIVKEWKEVEMYFLFLVAVESQTYHLIWLVLT